MTIRFVSQQRGNDTNDGLTPETPWLTVTKAVQTLTAGQTCYVGSGTYREKPVNINAGTAGNLISFIGDPDSQFVIGDNPGIVRVTGCGIDEIATVGTVWTRQKDYVLLKNFVVDGNSTLYAIDCGSVVTNRFNENCVGMGVNSFNYGTNINCFAVSGYNGFSYGTNTNCLTIGSNYGYNNGTNINCLTIGGRYGFTGGTTTNCLTMGSYVGYYSGTNINCLAIGNYTGYNSGINNNCLAVTCNTGFTGGTITNCKASMCLTSGTGITISPVIIFSLSSMQKIIEAFEPWMFEGTKQWGDTSVDAGTIDILGRTRKMLGGGLDIGPYAFSDVKPDFTNYQTLSPAITITTAGQKIFEVPAKSGVAITITVQSKWTGATLLPQIIFTGDTITTQTTTNTAASDTWQELLVTATPLKDEILKLYLTAQDTTTGATATFSDITVS